MGELNRVLGEVDRIARRGRNFELLADVVEQSRFPQDDHTLRPHRDEITLDEVERIGI